MTLRGEVVSQDLSIGHLYDPCTIVLSLDTLKKRLKVCLCYSCILQFRKIRLCVSLESR